MTDTLKIKALRIRNIKALASLDVEPGEHAVVMLEARNGAGKSTVIDSLAYVLGGKEQRCGEPLRRGAQKGSIEVDLGEYTATLAVSDKGETLTVAAPSGARFPTPQKILDSLWDPLAADPLALMREPKKLAALFRKLTGLDFTKHDAERKALYDQRTLVNRDLKVHEGALASIVHYPDAPETEVSAAALVAELDGIKASNARNATVRKTAADLEAARDRRNAAVTAIENEIAALRVKLSAAQTDAANMERTAANARRDADALVDTDEAPVRARIDASAEVNGKVRCNRDRATKAALVDTTRQKSADLTAKIDALDVKRAEVTAAAKLPVPGLAIGADEIVTLDGLPLDQASTSQQIRTTMAMVLATEPRLRAVCIRDGSLLDPDSLALVAEVAQAAGAQVLIERVGPSSAVTVVFYDPPASEAP